MIPKFRAWHKTWEEMGWIARIRYKKSGEIARLSFRRNIYDGNIYGGLVNLDEIILMQSTGLKDKNGKEIFEGDIITNGQNVMCMKRHNTLGFYVEEKGEVEFIADSAVLEDFEEDAKEIADSLEIIGNIYENKELLDA